MNTSWLDDFRQHALARFEKTGFPSSQLEDWHYTNCTAIVKQGFLEQNGLRSPEIRLSDQAETTLQINKIALLECYHFVLIDGKFNTTLSTLPECVKIYSIHEAIEKHAAWLQPKFNQAIKSSHGFIDFNTAHFTDGVFILVPENVVIDKPLQIIHLSTSRSVITTRHMIIIENNATLNAIETFTSLNDTTYLTNSVLEVFIGEKAHLTLYKAQQESKNAYHFGGIYVKQSDNSRFTHHNFAFGSILARCDVMSYLGMAAECEFNGLYLGSQKQHLDNFTRIHHLKSQGISRQLYKGILNHQAHGVFQARIVVNEKAQKIDSKMTNRNLLLSNEAEIDTKPQLEIYADDVKCSHGVTVGELEESAIFYLQSRGIDMYTARQMLTFAFANEMLEKIKIRSLHDAMLEKFQAISA